MAIWPKKGDLVEFRVNSKRITEHKIYCAPQKRFDWNSRYLRPLIKLECNKTHVGLVVDVYRISFSRHVANPVVPDAKKQPGPRQKLFQENFREWYYHILWEDKIVLVESGQLKGTTTYPYYWEMKIFYWEMKVLQKESVHDQ